MANIPTQGTMTFVIQMPESAGGETSGTEVPSPANPKQEGNDTGNPVKGGKDIQGKIAIGYELAKGAVTQMTNSYVSQIGLSTGNYYKQRQAERAISGLQTAAGMVTALATGNYVALATMAISTGISAYFEQKQQNKEREIANYQAEQYAKRLGYTVDRK